jgi:serine/threonine protein kinase
VIEAAGDLHVKRARERIGMVLGGKWTIESLLGVGGMAAVYAATHRNGKRVAVKMLHADLSDHEEVRKRFLQEGYAANTIQHDGAVSVLDDDVAADGCAFIVMELLEGETVEDRWDRSGRRLAAREVLAIVEQVLGVLSAAHAKNIVHRDIKPENLFVTKAGAVKVLDFGIAKVFEAD